MDFRRALGLLAGLVVCVSAAASAAPAEPERKPGWTPETVASETADCREVIGKMAWKLYMSKLGVDEKSVTAEQRAAFPGWSAPAIKPCGCLMEHMSQTFSHDYYDKHSPDVHAKQMEFVGTVCPTNDSPETDLPLAATGCLHSRPDPKGFPFASVAEARLAMEKLKLRSKTDNEGTEWSTYYDAGGRYAVDVTSFSTSKFGTAMIWRRVDWEGNQDFLYSTRCEGDAQQCKDFDKWQLPREAKRTLGTCS
jgi:hypothetical protein